MATPKILENLRKLNKKEVKVLFFICRDGTEQEITDKINGLDGTQFQIETIRRRKTKIYEKLEISSAETKEQKRISFQPYCLVLNEVAPQYSDLENWPLILDKASILPLKESEGQPEEAKVEEKKEDEDKVAEKAEEGEGQPEETQEEAREQEEKEEEQEEKEDQDKEAEKAEEGEGQPEEIKEVDKKGEEEEIVIEPRAEEKPSRLEWWHVFALLGVILVAFLIFRNPPPWITPDETPALTPTESIATTATKRAIVPTLTFTPKTPTNIPTVTPSPTSTITPKPTRTLNPTPVILLYDDFSKKNPEWEIIVGQPFVSGGVLISEGEAWLSRGDPGWTNYRVTIHASTRSTGCAQGDQPNIFAIRMNGRDNMMALHVDACYFAMFIIKDGHVTPVPNTTSGEGNEYARYVITAYGNYYTVTVDGKKYADFYDETFTQGNIGIALWQNASVDDIKVIELP